MTTSNEKLQKIQDVFQCSPEVISESKDMLNEIYINHMERLNSNGEILTDRAMGQYRFTYDCLLEVLELLGKSMESGSRIR